MLRNTYLIAMALIATSTAVGQTVLDVEQSGAVQGILMPLEGSDTPLFAAPGAYGVAPQATSQTVTPGTAAGGPTFATTAATPIAGTSATTPTITNAGNIIGNGVVSFDIGFSYVFPIWSEENFSRVIPINFAGQFDTIVAPGAVIDEFAFSPELQFGYEVNDSNFGVEASGYFLNIKGKLNRSLQFSDGAGKLDSTAQLTLVVANILEASLQVDGENSHLMHCLHLSEGNAVFTLGARYASLTQKFQATLTDQELFTTRDASQSFVGAGLTGSLLLQKPIENTRTSLYSKFRQSLLVGDNERHGSFTATQGPEPGMILARSQIDDSATSLIPVSELEMGIIWGNAPQGNDAILTSTGRLKPLVWVKAGVQGQFWNDVGMVAAGDSDGFSDSDLFLVGFLIMAGIQR